MLRVLLQCDVEKACVWRRYVCADTGSVCVRIRDLCENFLSSWLMEDTEGKAEEKRRWERGPEWKR